MHGPNGHGHKNRGKQLILYGSYMPKEIQGRRLIAAALLLLSLATNAFAQADSPLPPGKPAGVHEAQSKHAFENTLLIGMSVVGVGIGFLWAIQAGRSSSPAAATATTSTSP
jgi:hypothetical protein